MKAVIIDDESKGIEILRILLEINCPNVNVIGHAEEIEEAVRLIDTTHPDLVFLDIEMPGENGFSVLEKVKAKNLHVIFVTAHSQYAVKAFRYSVTDFLLKPVDAAELKDAVQKTENLIRESRNESANKEEVPSTLRIPLANRTIFIKMSDIIRLEADGAYTRIFVPNQQYVASYNIRVFEEHLDKNYFMRVHRSHIINLYKIKKLVTEKKLLAEMTDDSRIKISRRIKNSFLLQFEKIMTSHKLIP